MEKLKLFMFDEVLSNDFPGKLEFMCFVEDETLCYQSEEKRTVSELIVKSKRAVDLDQKSEFKKYWVHAHTLLLLELEKEPDSTCLVTCYSKEPFYQYYLLQNSQNGKPYGCFWGPDIQKTPEDIWHKMFLPDYIETLT